VPCVPTNSATSTPSSSSQQLPSSPDPSDWSIEDVINYVKHTDTGLAPYVEHFRKHEIDGKAFLLLKSELMLKYMGLKLGPVVKLCSLIDRLKAQWTK